MKTIPEKLSNGLWVLILIIIGVASMTSIRWVSPALHIESNFGPSRNLTYALVLGLGVLIVACFASFYRAAKISPFLKIAVALLIAGLSLSSFFATDKALAFYTGTGLLLALGLMFAAWRLADAPWKFQLALITLTALGVTFAAKAWIRECCEFDETWKQYYETREDFWAKQNKTLDDPAVKMFEARIKSRDNGGFFFHGNLGGMYLATVWFASLALVIKRFRRRNLPLGNVWLTFAVLMNLFILSALILTMSKGAIAATALSGGIILFLWIFAKTLRVHFRSAVIAVLIILTITASAIVGYRLIRKTLPTLSMAYRWQYWVASYQMFLDHPIVGVGSGNFGHYYLRYKLPEAQEEVTSPHNFIAEGLTEFGAIGGIGFLLLPLAVFYQIAKNRPQESTTIRIHGPSAPQILLAILLGIFATLFVFNQTGHFAFLGLVAEYLPYLIIFPAAFVLAGIQGDRFDEVDPQSPAPAEILCLAGGLIAFILGDIVNFSLEEPSTQFLFFFIAGLTLAASSPRPATKNDANVSPSPIRLILKPAVCLGFIFVYCYFLLAPAFQGENAAIAGAKNTTASDPAFDSTYQTYADLARRYTYDAHLCDQTGKRLIDIAKTSPQPMPIVEQALPWYQQAADRAPKVSIFRADLGQCCLMLAALDSDRKFVWLDKTESALAQARSLAPRSKTLALTLGLVAMQHLQDLPPADTAQITRLTNLARKNLTDAKNLDRALPPESLHRFSNQQQRQLDAAIRFLDQKEKTKP